MQGGALYAGRCFVCGAVFYLQDSVLFAGHRYRCRYRYRYGYRCMQCSAVYEGRYSV